MGAAPSTPGGGPAPPLTTAAAAAAATARSSGGALPATKEAPTTASGAKLYRFVPDRASPAGGAWELVAGDVFPSFFDAAADEAGAPKPRWRLEIGDLEADVTDEYAADAGERRLTLALPPPSDEAGGGAAASGGGGGVWALRFPHGPGFRAFLDEWELCLYENAFGPSPAARAARAAAAGAGAGTGTGRGRSATPPPPAADELFGPDSVLNVGPGGETAASRAAWAAADDAAAPGGGGDGGGGDDDDDDEEAAPGPTSEALAADAILGLRLGAGDRSYLLRGGGRVEALANVPGGVRGAGVGFTLTPPPGAGALGGGGRRGTPSSLGRPGGATADAGGAGGPPTITPSRVILMDRERRLAALGGGEAGGAPPPPPAGPSVGRDRLFDADLETGTVVAAWALRKDGVDVAMDDLANEARGAQLDGRSTFLGLGANRLVRWDLRDARGAVSDAGLDPSPPGGPGGTLASPAVATYAGGKDYARGARFTCMATSGDGCVAVGSADGQVRLYSERTLTRAATSIPGLGAPVTAIDVTYDGGWVLATTDRYLMLIKAAYAEAGSGARVDAFHARMGRSAPAPRLLRLRPEDAARTGHAPLTKGKFTWVTQPGTRERWIAASCGAATVLWSFRAVRHAPPDTVGWGGLTACTDYTLIPKGESVLDSVFVADRHGGGGGGGEEETPPARRGGRRGASATPGGRATPASGMVIVTDRHVFSTARRRGGGGSSSEEDDDE